MNIIGILNTINNCRFIHSARPHSVRCRYFTAHFCSPIEALTPNVAIIIIPVNGLGKKKMQKQPIKRFNEAVFIE